MATSFNSVLIIIRKIFPAYYNEDFIYSFFFLIKQQLRSNSPRELRANGLVSPGHEVCGRWW